MGKQKGAEGAVDSDYSGRPVRRPTPEEIREEDQWAAPGDFICAPLDDGTIVYEGPDRKLFYAHFEGYRPIWDRPVDPKDYPEGWPRRPWASERGS